MLLLYKYDTPLYSKTIDRLIDEKAHEKEGHFIFMKYGVIRGYSFLLVSRFK